MKPLDAIKSGVSKTFVFSGRASRSEFWWMLLFCFCVIYIYTIAFASAFFSNSNVQPLKTGSGAESDALSSYMHILPFFLLNLFMLPTMARRFKDHGWRGGWFKVAAYMNTAAGVGMVLGIAGLLVGADELLMLSEPFCGFLIVIPYSSIIFCLWIGFVRREPGPDQFGPNPAEVIF